MAFGFHFIKQNDWEKPTYGKLTLPYEYKDLLQEHIDANVINIEERSLKDLKDPKYPNFYEATTTVKLDIGKKQNVTKGLSLYLHGETLKVINVQDTTCQATIVQQIELTEPSLNNCEDKECDLIKVGDKFSTKYEIFYLELDSEENKD